MTSKRLTPPQNKPVSLAETKNNLKIDHDGEDELLSGLIDQATDHVESYTGLRLIEQEWRFAFDCVPEDHVFNLSQGPLRSVAAMRFISRNSQATEIPGSDYQVDDLSRIPRINLHSYSASALQTDPSQLNAIEIDAWLGFGPIGTEIPEDIRRALLLTIAHWYEYRGAVDNTPNLEAFHGQFSRLLSPYIEIKL